MIEVLELLERTAAHKTTCSSPARAARQGGSGARDPRLSLLAAARPFVAVNCGALPDAPCSRASCFGTRRAPFTGADRARRGLFEEADSGTLFLDEIGELPLALPGEAPARACQEEEIRPVGTSKTAASTCASIAGRRRGGSRR
jgi:two-component system response regulator AtoC